MNTHLRIDQMMQIDTPREDTGDAKCAVTKRADVPPWALPQVETQTTSSLPLCPHGLPLTEISP